MPDPRFDGSLDAPRLVDRGQDAVCTDCGQPESHRNHDERNEAGHFFNTSPRALVSQRAVTAPQSATARITARRAGEEPRPAMRTRTEPLVGAESTSEASDPRPSAAELAALQHRQLVDFLRELHVDALELIDEVTELTERRDLTVDAVRSLSRLLKGYGVDVSAYEIEIPDCGITPSSAPRPAAPQTAKVHKRNTTVNDQPRCRVYSAGQPLNLTDDDDAVTCRSCIRMMESDARVVESS